jgi:hypothetical protein
MDLTPTQRATLKTAIQAEPSLASPGRLRAEGSVSPSDASLIRVL